MNIFLSARAINGVAKEQFLFGRIEFSFVDGLCEPNAAVKFDCFFVAMALFLLALWMFSKTLSQKLEKQTSKIYNHGRRR